MPKILDSLIEALRICCRAPSLTGLADTRRRLSRSNVLLVGDWISIASRPVFILLRFELL